MCNFLSALGLPNGDVLHHPMLDSHGDLVTYFKMPDESAFVRRFTKHELVPVDWIDPATWRFVTDEPTRPDWLTDEIEREIERKMRAVASRMILRDGEHRLIVDGCWIIAGTAK